MALLNAPSPLLWQFLQYGDRDGWLDFLGMHNAWHQALAGQTSQPAVPFDDLLQEMGRHARAHEAVAVALKLTTPPDLETYDLREEGAFLSWTRLHALEHQRLRLTAGL